MVRFPPQFLVARALIGHSQALSKPYWRFRLKDENGFSHIPRSIHLRDPNEALVFLLESGKLYVQLPGPRFEREKPKNAFPQTFHRYLPGNLEMGQKL